MRCFKYGKEAFLANPTIQDATLLVTMNQIVVCIPTEFDSRQALAAALESKYGTEYVFIGRIFRSTTTQDSCEIQISDRSAELIEAFELVEWAMSTLLKDNTATTLQQIARHQQVVYLLSNDTGYEACRQIARLAGVLLNVGGIAVKVESAGIAREKAWWLERCGSDDVFDIYSLFVTLIEGDNYYSCGMHNFGKADVAIAMTEDLSMAIYVMNVFNYYRLTESPILQDGHTFRPDIESPAYRLQWIEDRESSTELLHNTHGRWYLSRI